MAAPAWESKGADFSNTSAVPGFAVPAGTAAGKIIIISFFVNVKTTTVDTVPSGFAVVPGTPVLGKSNSLQKFWKRLTGADAGTYDFGLSSAQFVEGAAELFNNCVASGSPFDPSPGFANEDNIQRNITPPVSTSTVEPDRLVLHTGTIWAGGAWTPNTGYTKRLQPPVGLITTSDKVEANATATGSIVATSTLSDFATAHIVGLIGTTVAGGSVSASISDEARTNMLAQLAQAEPQNKSNADLMREVLAFGGQTLITATQASAATHLERYLVTLRNT